MRRAEADRPEAGSPGQKEAEVPDSGKGSGTSGSAGGAPFATWQHERMLRAVLAANRREGLLQDVLEGLPARGNPEI